MPALVKALDTENWQTTWAAAETLKRIGTPEAMKAVEKWQQARDADPDADTDGNGDTDTDSDAPIVEIVDDAESDPGAE